MLPITRSSSRPHLPDQLFNGARDRLVQQPLLRDHEGLVDADLSMHQSWNQLVRLEFVAHIGERFDLSKAAFLLLREIVFAFLVSASSILRH